MSRAFFWWYIGIQVVPLAGIIAVPSIATVWVLIVLANTCVFFFNVARYMGRAGQLDARTNRLLFLVIAALFAVMTLSWGARLTLGIYRSAPLGF